MHAAARLVQAVFRRSEKYQQWQAKKPLEEDPARIEFLKQEEERKAVLAERNAARLKALEEQQKLDEKDRAVFRIQEWWRYNRNRRHLEARGLRTVVQSKVAAVRVEEEQAPQSDLDLEIERLQRVEAAYQKALQMRGAIQATRSPLPPRVEEQLAAVLHPCAEPDTLKDHTTIEDFEKTCPLNAVRMASQYPAGKYNHKYQRKYALGQDGRYLEHGYNSEDSSGSSLTDSDECSSDEGIDRMTL